MRTGCTFSVMKLQHWMDRKGLKDADLAALTAGKLSRSQVSRIRRGASNPSLDTARELERLTRIPVAKFLTGEAGLTATQQDAAA